MLYSCDISGDIILKTMAGNKQTFTLDEAVDILNDWLDEENNPPEDAVDDLRDLNGNDIQDYSNQSESDEDA